MSLVPLLSSYILSVVYSHPSRPPPPWVDGKEGVSSVVVGGESSSVSGTGFYPPSFS